MSGDRDSAEALAASASDLDLSAANVELRDAARVRVVDSELLNAEEVFACRNTRGDLDVVRLSEVPGRGAAGEGRTNLLDLEPWGGAVSTRGGVDLAHVATCC